MPRLSEKGLVHVLFPQLMVLPLFHFRNGCLRLPSGRSPREAKVRHFETGPLDNNLKKGCE